MFEENKSAWPLKIFENISIIWYTISYSGGISLIDLEENKRVISNLKDRIE